MNEEKARRFHASAERDANRQATIMQALLRTHDELYKSELISDSVDLLTL